MKHRMKQSVPTVCAVLVCGLLSAACSAGEPAAAEASGKKMPFGVSFTELGAPLIRLDANLLTQKREPGTPVVAFRDPQKPVHMLGSKAGDYPPRPGDLQVKEAHWDETNKTLTQVFSWGEVRQQWTVSPDRLDLEVRIENRSDRTLCVFDLDLLRLALPEEGRLPMLSAVTYFGQPGVTDRMDTWTGPMVLPLVVGSHALVAVSPEQEKFLDLGWVATRSLSKNAMVPQHGDPEAVRLAEAQEGVQSGAGKSTGRAWKLRLSLGGERLLWHDRYASRPIAPGGSDAVRVSLRLGTAGDPLAAGKDIFEAHRRRHPQLLDWKDRRPIYRGFIGDTFKVHQPDGPDPGKPAGVTASPEFRQKLLKHADELIASMKANDAQGFIFWNVEGGNEPQIKYVGSPALVEKMSPEMDQVADEFFKKIRDAGFRTGVCLRPSTIVALPDESGTKWGWRHRNPFHRDVVEVLDEKIVYAKKRWGCTLFYIDTNVVIRFPETEALRANWPQNAQGEPVLYRALMNAEQWAELARRHPDVLLIPEHCYHNYYASVARYSEMDHGAVPTPPIVRAVWPSAFKVIFSGRGGPSTRWWESKIQAMLAGEVMGLNFPAGTDGLLLAQAAREVEYRRQGEPRAVARGGERDWERLALDVREDPAVRWFAAQRLLSRAEPVSPETLRTLLEDGDWLLQKAAVDGIKAPSHLPLLATAYALMDRAPMGESFGPLLNRAVARLGDGGVAWVVDHIRRGGEGGATGRKIFLFGQVDHPAVPPALKAMLEDEGLPEGTRLAAARALARSARKEGPAEAMEGLLASFRGRPISPAAVETVLTVGALLKSGDPERARRFLSAVLEQLKTQEKSGGTGAQRIEALLRK